MGKGSKKEAQLHGEDESLPPPPPFSVPFKCGSLQEWWIDLVPKIAPDGGAGPGPGYDELAGIKEGWLMMSLAIHL